MPGFGPELYRWERDYFHENLVRGVCGIEPGAEDAAVLEAELGALAERLHQTGTSLVHRDFQSGVHLPLPDHVLHPLRTQIAVVRGTGIVRR